MRGSQIHVTLVTSTFLHPTQTDFPGVGRYSVELARALTDQGDTVRVVTSHFNETTVGEIANGVEVIHLPGSVERFGRLSSICQLNTLAFGRRFARTYWLHTETDIIHTSVPLLGIERVKGRRPVLAFLHHIGQVRSLPDLLTVPFGNSYGAYTCRQADAVAVPSRASATEVREGFRVNDSKIAVVHHGVSPSTFFPGKGGKGALSSQDSQFILYVGGTDRRKNLPLLVDSFKILRKSHPRLKLFLVASGPIDNRASRSIRDSGLSGAIIRHERLADDELHGLYSSCKVFVTPSLKEGFGFPAVEAMACGAPVVALKTPANEEIIGDAGLLVRENSPIAFASAIQRVLSDRELARLLAERGVRRVRREYSWEAAARAYRDLYLSLIESENAQNIAKEISAQSNMPCDT